MLKKERMHQIVTMVNQKGIINVSEIVEQLKVSDMTIRRDLDELEGEGRLIRIHGGAQSIEYSLAYDDMFSVKSNVFPREMREMAAYASSLIHEGDTVFLGAGTVIEALASMIQTKNVRIVTNSHAVFCRLSAKKQNSALMVGGHYSPESGSFTGTLANHILSSLKFTVAFLSASGLSDDSMTAGSLEEGEIQRIVLENSRSRYLLHASSCPDASPDDFYVFGKLMDLDALILDASADPKLWEEQSRCTKIIQTGIGQTAA